MKVPTPTLCTGFHQPFLFFNNMIDFEDFVILNGGIDARKLIGKSEAIKKNCKKKLGNYQMNFFGIHTPEEIQQHLIKNATPEEKKFMKKLDERGEEYEFQKIIRKPKGGFYVVDFYFPFKNLIIEIDGLHHKLDDEIKLNDQIRDEYLKRNGYKIKRITNEEINRWL